MTIPKSKEEEEEEAKVVDPETSIEPDVIGGDK